MPLIVDYRKCEPITEAEYSGIQSIGIAMSVLGMSQLDSLGHVMEITARGEYYKRLNGEPILRNSSGQDLNCYAFWFRWLGISVNVKKETRVRWMSRIGRSFMADIGREVLRQEGEHGVAAIMRDPRKPLTSLRQTEPATSPI